MDAARHAVFFDCEFLTTQTAQTRFWCGPDDPDPVIAQIGAVRVALDAPFDEAGSFRCHVIPPARDGGAQPLDPFFTRLTGITPDDIADDGLPLTEALARLDAFAQGAALWSWGKDEFNMVAISCYVAGITPSIPVSRFGNACALMRRAGMPLVDIHSTRSNTLPGYFDLDTSDLAAHDALDDARAVSRVAQHLLRNGRLNAADFIV